MSDAKSSLSNFIARVKKNGLLQASHFYIVIPNFAQKGDSRDLLMFCDTADLPGINLMTTEIRQFGELTTLPHAPMYQPIQLSFICDQTMAVKTSLLAWLNSVFDRENRFFNYYEQYTKNVEIYITDKNGRDVYKVTLNEAYPTAIGNIQLDYANEQIIKIPVTIAYKWWKAEPYARQYREEPFSMQKQLPVQVPVFAGDIKPGTAHYFNGSKFDGFQFLSANPSLQPENQAIFTGITASGSTTGNVMQTNAFGRIVGNSSNDIMIFGNSVQNQFGKAGNGLAAAFMVAPVTTTQGASYVSQMAVHAKTISADMGGYAQGLVQLGKDVSSITRPASIIGQAVTSLGGTLSAIDGTLGAIGITSQPFQKVARVLYGAGGKIGVAANLRGISGGLQTVGANMTATSSIFQQVQGQLAGKEGFTKSVETAMNNMSRAFSNYGQNTMNAANVLADRAGD